MKNQPKCWQGDRRMFRKGEPIKNMVELSERLERNEWLFLHSRPKHPGWMVRMTWHTLSQMVKGGRIFEAIRNDTISE